MYDQMDTLYQDVLTGRTMWQSTVMAQAAREAKWKVAPNKIDPNMLSRQEYLEIRSSYPDGMAARAQAGVNFQQAMDIYDWTVRGLVATN